LIGLLRYYDIVDGNCDNEFNAKIFNLLISWTDGGQSLMLDNRVFQI